MTVRLHEHEALYIYPYPFLNWSSLIYITWFLKFLSLLSRSEKTGKNNEKHVIVLLLYFSWNICIWPNCVLCCYPYNAYLHLCSKNMLLMFCCCPCNTCYYFVFFYDFNWIMNPIGTMILLLLSTGYLFMLMTSIGYLSMLMILLLLSIQLSVCARLQLDDICDLILGLLSIGLSVCAPLLYLIWCDFIFLIHAYLVSYIVLLCYS